MPRLILLLLISVFTVCHCNSDCVDISDPWKQEPHSEGGIDGVAIMVKLGEESQITDAFLQSKLTCLLSANSNSQQILQLEFKNCPSLTEIPAQFCDRMINLRRFTVLNTGLTTIPDNLFRNTLQLQTIDLESNNIQTLPTDLFDFLPNGAYPSISLINNNYDFVSDACPSESCRLITHKPGVWDDPLHFRMDLVPNPCVQRNLEASVYNTDVHKISYYKESNPAVVQTTADIHPFHHNLDITVDNSETYIFYLTIPGRTVIEADKISINTCNLPIITPNTLRQTGMLLPSSYPIVLPDDQGHSIQFGGLFFVSGDSETSCVTQVFYGDYECSIESITATSIQCMLAAGVGSGHRIFVHRGEYISVGASGISYAAPLVTSSTLRSVESAAGSDTITRRLLDNRPIFFDGHNFGSEPSKITVTYGSFECHSVEFSATNSNTLTCTPSTALAPAENLEIVVTVAGQSASVGFFTYIPQTEPTITSITTEQGNCKQKEFAIGLYDCLTVGNFPIDITGIALPTGDVTILVAGNECFYLPLESNENKITCILSPGTGANQPLLISQADYALPLDDALSYAAPELESLSSDIVSRTGGETLIITGRNFGGTHNNEEPAAVFISSKPCIGVTHLGAGHDRIQCTIPSGLGATNPVMVVQHNGVASLNSLNLKYVPCPPGTYEDQQTEKCVDCPIGSFGDQPGLKQCIDCQRGSYGDSPGLSSCISCRPGEYSSAIARTTPCDLCPAGNYNPLYESTSCLLKCPPGQFSLQAAGNCTNCPAGQMSYEGSGGCIKCPAGMYTPRPGYPVCEVCLPGTFSNISGSAQCYPCSGGARYQPSKNQTSCLTCEDGESSLDSIGCLPAIRGTFSINGIVELCPINEVSLTEGSTKCEKCAANTMSNDDHTACVVTGFMPSGIAGPLYAVICVAMAISVCTTALVIYKFSTPSLLTRQPPMIVSTCIGLICTFVGLMFLVQRQSDPECAFGFLFTHLGITLSMTGTLMKFWRIDRIFNNKLLVVKHITARDIVVRVIILSCIDVAIMMVQLIASPFHFDKYGWCRSDTTLHYSMALYSLKTIYLITMCVLIGRIRNIDMNYRASKTEIGAVVMNIALLSITIITTLSVEGYMRILLVIIFIFLCEIFWMISILRIVIHALGRRDLQSMADSMQSNIEKEPTAPKTSSGKPRSGSHTKSPPLHGKTRTRPASFERKLSTDKMATDTDTEIDAETKLKNKLHSAAKELQLAAVRAKASEANLNDLMKRAAGIYMEIQKELDMEQIRKICA